MEWIKAEIKFVSAFSYRMPDTSSLYAIPMLLPGPSTIKLALVATSILQSGRIEEGAFVFELVKRAKIKFILPERISVFRPLIRRLKPKSGSSGGGFESTYGTRGYVFYSGPVILYLGLNKEIEKIASMLRYIRRLGTSDSFVNIENLMFEAPPNSLLVVEPLSRLHNIEKEGLLQRVKDIVEWSSFADVNPFEKSVERKRGSIFVTKFYILPVRAIKEGGNWVLYKTLST